MNKEKLKACITFFLLISINLVAQWKYPNARKIKNDIVITYDVVYENELSEKQKKSPYYKKQVIVIFRDGKILEKNISSSLEYQLSVIYDYNKELAYNCRVDGTKKSATVSKFRAPKKKVSLNPGEKDTILGFPCDVYSTKVRGKTRKIYTTKKFGLRYVKYFNAEGFLLKYAGQNHTL